METSKLDERTLKAIWRYGIISPFFALKPGRGAKRELLEKLAAEIHTGLDGLPKRIRPETLRAWIRRYRKDGLDGLKDKGRERKGVASLTESQKELLCNLKREVPERSVERVICVAEAAGLFEEGELTRSKVYRVLAAEGLSKRKLKTPDKKDLDRFEADYPNALWQSDMLVGPYLKVGDKSLRTKLFLFMDDHSRMILSGRFSFNEKLPNLELVFRDSLRSHGRPVRAYFDNGMVYRAEHIRLIAAELGIHLIFTRPYRPEGHGKIEALNRKIRSSFLAEVKASKIETLDQLNEAFLAWIHEEHNTKVHRETRMTPTDRWRSGIEKIRFVSEQEISDAFSWKEKRKADKTGVLSLFGCRYQVSPELAGTKLDLRYDPEALQEIEIWKDGVFVERSKPLDIKASRRPRQKEIEFSKPHKEPTADYLGGMVERYRQKGPYRQSPAEIQQQKRAETTANNEAVAALLEERLDDAVFEPSEVYDFLEKYGPFEPRLAKETLDEMIQGGRGTDYHVVFYLDAIRKAAFCAGQEAKS